MRFKPESAACAIPPASFGRPAYRGPPFGRGRDGAVARWLLGPRATWGAVFRPPAAASGVFRFCECGGLRFGILPFTPLVWASRFTSSCSASLRAVGRSGRAGTALVLRSSLRCGCSSCALGLCGCSLCLYLLALAALQGHSCRHRCALVSNSALRALWGPLRVHLTLNYVKLRSD